MKPWEKYQQKEGPWSKYQTPSTGMGQYVAKGLAEGLGAPADLIGGALSLTGLKTKDPFAGAESIKRGMEAIGLPVAREQPESIGGHVGQTVGEVSSMLIPMGAGVKALSGGTKLIGRVADNIWKGMVKHPYLTMTGEATGGVGSGLGRGIAEQEGLSPAMKSIAEMGGGVAGGMAPGLATYTPTATAIRLGKPILQKFSVPFSKPGSIYRAGKFAKGLVPDPAKAATRATEPTIGDLPHAVASGEKKIIQLYKSLIGQDAKTDDEAIEQISRSIVTLEKEMRKLGYGAPGLLEEITRKRVAAIELNMDRRVLQTMDNAQTKLDAMPIAKRRVDEARIVRNELETVMRAEQEQVRALWRDVNKDIPVRLENTRAKYASLVDDLAQAQMDDVPRVLKLSPITTGDETITNVSLKEMQGLRSKLLESARLARKNSQWNRARIADEVADAILDDIGIVAGQATTPEAAQLQAALQGTRQFKVRFEQGEVGKLLGFAKTGAPAIDPDLTLDLTIGRLGTRGSIDLEKIVVTPEARKATERYLARSYTEYASDATGAIKPSRSEDWIKNNESILDQFPDLRQRMTSAAEAQHLAMETRATMEARKARIQNPKISTAAKYLNAADMRLEVATILKAKNPSRMANELMRQARKDPEAVEGVRAAFVNHIMEKASVGEYNNVGERTLSGPEILGFVNKNIATLERVFDAGQLKRMRQIGRELAKIKMFEKARYDRADIDLKDMSSLLLEIGSRVGGAQVGRVVAGATGGGNVQTPGIFSKNLSRLMNRLTGDRAKQMINDAIISNPELFKTLMMPIPKPEVGKVKWTRLVNDQLNVWLIGAGKRVMEDVEQEISLDQGE